MGQVVKLRHVHEGRDRLKGLLDGTYRELERLYRQRPVPWNKIREVEGEARGLQSGITEMNSVARYASEGHHA